MFNNSLKMPLFCDTSAFTLIMLVLQFNLLLWNEIPGTLASHNCTTDLSPCVSTLVWHSQIMIMLQNQVLFLRVQSLASSNILKKVQKKNIECIE